MMSQKHAAARTNMTASSGAEAPSDFYPDIDGTNWRMLLIEDEASDVFLAEELMESSMPDYRWNIIDRPRVIDAIDMLQHIKFHLAFVDLGLHDIRGVEAVSLLHMTAPELPLVVYTGSNDTDLLRETLYSGASFCIEKGRTDPRMVRAIIRCILEPHP